MSKGMDRPSNRVYAGLFEPVKTGEAAVVAQHIDDASGSDYVVGYELGRVDAEAGASEASADEVEWGMWGSRAEGYADGYADHAKVLA